MHALVLRSERRECASREEVIRIKHLQEGRIHKGSCPESRGNTLKELKLMTL
jgi:hypothetical protein